MQIEDRVRELVQEKIADREDLFIVRIKMYNSGVLEILMDGDQGIPIEDCAQISRHVGFHLEEENALEKAYRLEVSSPGVDTPLLLERQYVKNIGRELQVKTTDEQKRVGKLLAVTETGFSLAEEVKEKGKKSVLQSVEIPFEIVKETKVLISFK